LVKEGRDPSGYKPKGGRSGAAVGGFFETAGRGFLLATGDPGCCVGGRFFSEDTNGTTAFFFNEIGGRSFLTRALSLLSEVSSFSTMGVGKRRRLSLMRDETRSGGVSGCGLIVEAILPLTMGDQLDQTSLGYDG
jgi:hypothetical protein